jgi:hypothetical protein
MCLYMQHTWHTVILLVQQGNYFALTVLSLGVIALNDEIDISEIDGAINQQRTEKSAGPDLLIN